MSNPSSPDESEGAAHGAAEAVGADEPKPPRAGQFKKGQSGNPRGRPRGSLNKRARLDKVATAAFSKPVRVCEDGVVRTVTALDAFLGATCARALKGDLAAAAAILKVATQLGLFDPPPTPPYGDTRAGILYMHTLWEETEYQAYRATGADAPKDAGDA